MFNSETSHDQAGYHLLDILIALLILGALLFLSLPAVNGAAENQSLKSETRTLELLLKRMATLSHQREKDLLITLRKTLYAAREKGKDGLPIEKRHFRSGVTADLGQGSSRTIYFYKGDTATPYTITLRDGSSSCQIIISLRARVRATC